MKTIKDFKLIKKDEIKYPIYTYDDNWSILTYKDSNWFWYEYTRDDKWNELTYKNSDLDWREYTRDDNWNILTYKDSDWDWYEYIKGWKLEYNKKENKYTLNWEEYILINN